MINHEEDVIAAAQAAASIGHFEVSADLLKTYAIPLCSFCVHGKHVDYVDGEGSRFPACRQCHSGEFVLRPGTKSADAFSSWEPIGRILPYIEGPKCVTLDGRYGACHITSGRWNASDTTLVNYAEETVEVIFDEGAVLVNLSGVAGNVKVINESSEPAIHVGEGVHFLMVVPNDSVVPDAFLEGTGTAIVDNYEPDIEPMPNENDDN